MSSVHVGEQGRKELGKVREAIEGASPGDLSISRARLTPGIDVFLWIEPRDSQFEIDSSGSVLLYVACVNYGYRSNRVDFSTSSTNPHALAIESEPNGVLYVDPPHDKAAYINWDRVRLIARQADQKCDLVSAFNVHDGTSSAELFLQARTGPYEALGS